MRLPVVTIIFVYLASIFCDWYIWKDLRHYLRNRLWSRIYACLSVLMLVYLTVVVCLPIRSQNDGIIHVMWMLYAYFSIYLPKFIYVVFSLLGRLPALFHMKRISLGTWVGLPLGLIVFGMMWWGAFVGRSEIDINQVEICSEKLPSSFEGYRIAQFSDAHVGTWGNDTTFISKFVDSINGLKPDLIVFTGDIVNRETSELEPFLKVLRRLHAPDGVFSILGNHDYGDYVDWNYPSERSANNALLAVWERQMGWRLLNNDHAFLSRDNDSIAVIGVENWGEPPFHQYGRLEDAYPAYPSIPYNLKDRRFKILLSHNPEHWRQEVSKNTNIDLTLSGHTHAMQFMIKLGDWRWSPSQYRYEQWGGLYETLNEDGEPSKIYVNVGSGEVAMPFRIGASPEITLITLRRCK